ncbi:MAG: hypothetical protein WBB66_01815 [Candidatus Omnitrophota bacterium]
MKIIIISTALMLFYVFIAFIGLFLYAKPSGAIELQKKFYEKINWRIEPVSMEKEIRNTRIMGLILLIATFVSIILSVLSCGAFADEDRKLPEKGVTQMEDFGGGQYMTGGGEIVQMDDLGDDDYLTTDGELIQTEDMGGGDYLTSEGKILQIEGEGKD